MSDRPDLAQAAHDDRWDPPPAAPAAQDEPIDWGRFIDAVRRRAWWIAAFVVAGAVVAAVATAREKKQYRAACSIVIETSTPRVLTGVENVVDVSSSGWVPESFYETEYEIMRSRAVARAAGEKIGLAPPADDAAGKGDVADLVIGRYRVEPDRKSSLVRITVEDTDPAFTAALSNAVAEAYVEQNLEKRISGTRDAGSWLAVQHTDLKLKLEASEDALYKFMADNDVLNASLESQLEEVKQRLAAFNAQLATEEGNAIREAKTGEVIAKVQQDPALIDTLEGVQTAPVINALKQNLEELKNEREKLAARYQPDHPKMDEIQKQVGRLEARLKAETGAVLAVQTRKQEQLKVSIQGLKEKLASEREREARLNKLSLEYARLKREVDTNAKLYDMVTNRMKEADITSALPFNNVRILDRALVPTYPFKPNLRSNLIVGVALAFLLAIGLAILLDLIDRTLKTQDDIENALKVPFLGLLPLIEGTKKQLRRATAETAADKRSRDLYVVEHPKSTMAECARFIRTNLMFMSPDKPLKTLVITSPGPSEGKTTTAVSVAVTMAQAGSRTLIVDTDLRKPRLHRVFDLPSDVGVSSVIVGEATLEQAIKPSGVPNLDVLVCGPLPPNPAEVLHTERFARLIEDLAARYDRVIFDSPPVGPVTDPVVVGTQVDGAVLVVKCEKTTREMGQQAVRALRDANVHLLGAILNDVDVNEKRYSRVYYAYYNRYGSYYAADKAPNPKAAAE